MADRWGNVNLFTTEGGFLWLNSPMSSLARGSIYLMMEVDGELISLIYSELTGKESIRIGTGYIEYRGVLKAAHVHLRLTQQVFAAPGRQTKIFVRFSLLNLAKIPFEGRLEIRGDVSPSRLDCSTINPNPSAHDAKAPAGWAIFPNAHEQLGDVFLATQPGWQGNSKRDTLRLSRQTRIEAGSEFCFQSIAGYGAPGTFEVSVPTLEKVQAEWARQLAPFAVPAAEPWMARESLWNMGQLLSFTAYDSSVDEYYISLGGYGWAGFSVREVSQTSMVLASGDWEMTAASLRFVAKTQLANGDVPKIHNLRRDRVSRDFDSDNELWFVLGCCESIATSGRLDFLDEVCAFWTKERARFGNT